MDMTKNIHAQRILILDFGSQYSQLIARRVREIGIYCELMSCATDPRVIQDFMPSGIILTGGPETVLDARTPNAPDCVFQLGCPVLGICYGMQTMAEQLGGIVFADAHSEFGHATLYIDHSNRLFEGIADHVSENGKTQLVVWMSHGDQVTQVPPGFRAVAHTKNSPIAVMVDDERHFYGVQFHPEVTHTRQGKRLIDRFVREICGCEALWTTPNIIDESIEELRDKIGNDKVILGLSGGVDSLVAAVLLHKAIENNLICIYVEHGLQRYAEAELLLNTQSKRLGLKVIHIDASNRFLAALKGIADPEEKRKTVGKLFIDVFTEQAKAIENVKWLAQGTIYSDVIESAQAGNYAHTIKSHHNVGGLPAKMSLPLIEPLRELFKDEVRQLGLGLGLPYDEVYRHPFPGAGLAIRILGEVTEAALDILRQADSIFMDELKAHDLYQKIAQAFCVYLPIKSVGVIGDARQYADVIALRAIESVDYMTANVSALPHEFLQNVAQRIVNEIPGISRVVYDITSKPPATIEWE
jgi:GMP synthase (glutamine-hydrolysing)